jgi:hypothetical protein
VHAYFIVLSQFDDLFFISDCLAFDNVLYACPFVDSFFFCTYMPYECVVFACHRCGLFHRAFAL